MAIEIVDFPINSMVIFHSYVKLPEGIWLVVKHIRQWEGLFHILWKIKHVPNHQPVMC